MSRSTESPENHSQKPLTLDLSRSREAGAFPTGESLWDRELDIMFRYLDTHRAAIERQQSHYKGNSHEDIWRDREQSTLLLSIAIFGSQGSGKSSLLKTFVEQILKKDEKFIKDIRNRVSTLHVIEPNLVAEDEHFLYTFLAHIWTEIEKLRDVDQSPEAMSPVERTFQEVGEYLHVVDPRSNVEKDPLGISLQRLDRHRSGPLLEEKIWELITRLARRLGGSNEKTLLVLPVDDADISYKRLLTILDTYRRYLRHPQLVPVFTFTSVMAEELLRVHYAKELNVREVQSIEDTSEEPEGLAETYTPARMTRQLATQFLARLFPNRHRIRLRMGATRLRQAKYTTEHATGGEDTVEHLLERASLLLYGEPEPPNGDKIRRVLLPSTLRRQLQIVDVLAHIKFDKDKREKELEKKPAKLWADAFDDATWAVMNIHRDVLSQLNLHVEELYGWTRRGLRPLVLEAILSLPLLTRRKLIQHWTQGSRDRRCHLLSLLGAQIARPPVEGAEDFEESGFEVSDRGALRSSRAAECDLPENLAIDTAFIWFLDVWFGFYLPQVLTVSRPRNFQEEIYERSKGDPDEARRSSPSTSERGSESHAKLARLHSAGWGLKGAATHALLESLVVRRKWVAGILKLSPRKEKQGKTVSSVADLLNKESKGSNAEANRIAQLLVAIWCNWGVHEGNPWAAVSLWRGLGLMGRVLFSARRRPENLGSKGAEFSTALEFFRSEKIRVKALLKEHCRSAPLPGLDGAKYPTEADIDDPKKRKMAFIFPEWPPQWLEKPAAGEDLLEGLAESLVAWRARHCDSRFVVRRSHTKTADDAENVDEVELKVAWNKCFVRRLHGEYLLGHFWQNLNRHHFENRAKDWNAYSALYFWRDSLLQYWKPTGVAPIIEKCPLFSPFTTKTLKGVSTKGSENIEGTEFPEDWTQDFPWRSEGHQLEGLKLFERLALLPQTDEDSASAADSPEAGEQADP